MTIDKKQLRAAVFGPFTDSGWEKRGQSAYSVGDHVGVVVNLQRSRMGEQHFINVGFWFRDREDPDRPKEHRCPVNRRLERVFPDSHELILTALDLEISTPERLSALGRLLGEEVVPLLVSLCSREALAEALRTGQLGRGMTTVEAKTTLGL